MKFKLDENFGARAQQLLRAAGHEVDTVRDEGLSGTSDQQLYDICFSEQRCLVTLDLDFADVLRYPPSRTGGIAVIRLPRNPTLAVLEQLIQQFLDLMRSEAVEKRLWIIEVGRVRIHQHDANNP